MKRIIIDMVVDYWSDSMRKELMQYLIHNLKVYDDENDDHTDFKGVIIEPANPPPLIPVSPPDDKIYDIEW